MYLLCIYLYLSILLLYIYVNMHVISARAIVCATTTKKRMPTHLLRVAAYLPIERPDGDVGQTGVHALCGDDGNGGNGSDYDKK